MKIACTDFHVKISIGTIDYLCTGPAQGIVELNTCFKRYFQNIDLCINFYYINT